MTVKDEYQRRMCHNTDRLLLKRKCMMNSVNTEETHNATNKSYSEEKFTA